MQDPPQRLHQDPERQKQTVKKPRIHCNVQLEASGNIIPRTVRCAGEMVWQIVEDPPADRMNGSRAAASVLRLQAPPA